MGQPHQVYFDTVVYANKLKEAGVASKEAEAQTEKFLHEFTINFPISGA